MSPITIYLKTSEFHILVEPYKTMLKNYPRSLWQKNEEDKYTYFPYIIKKVGKFHFIPSQGFS